MGERTSSGIRRAREHSRIWNFNSLMINFIALASMYLVVSGAQSILLSRIVGRNYNDCEDPEINARIDADYEFLDYLRPLR